VHRREFLKQVAVGASASLEGAKARTTPENAQQFKIGMAATLWLGGRPSTAAYWQACDALASIGIRAVEADNGRAALDATYLGKSEEFKRRMATNRMVLAGVSHRLPLHDRARLPEMRTRIAQLGAFLRSVRASYIALGWEVPGPVGGKPYERTPDDIRNAMRAANQLATISEEETGIVIGYYPERDESKVTIQRFLDGTASGLLRFVPDSGHLMALGFDPAAVVRTHGVRVCASHWKDFDPKLPAPPAYGSLATGDFTQLGHGIVDFAALADAHKKAGFKGWAMIDLDIPARNKERIQSARDMQAYVTGKLGLNLYAGAPSP
jgi:sugar phosphate isomerase/epimerase